MQIAATAVELRSRYYHSEMDMNLLETGAEYEKLTRTYVIFICDYDPFKQGKYRYTVEKKIRESPGYFYDDRQNTIILSTRGTNDDEEPVELTNFLKFVRHCDNLKEKVNDDFVEAIENRIIKVKHDRKYRGFYMSIEEYIADRIKEELKEKIEYELPLLIAEAKPTIIAEAKPAIIAEAKPTIIAEAKSEEICSLVSDGDLSPEKGAIRLGITMDQLKDRILKLGLQFPE